MAITVDPLTFIINIPQADLTLVSGTIYELDTDWFRLELKAWEAGGNGLSEGITFQKTHDHNTEVTIAGVVYARAIEILVPYSIEFQDAQYTVILKGSNNNIFDVENGILVQNQVQIISTNSAGLVVVDTGSGITPGDKTDIIEGVWDEVLSGTNHLVPDSAATALRSATYIIGSITLDTINGDAGTGWAIGTHFQPSNNLTDALTIMGYGNVHDLVLENNITVGPTHDISNLVVRTTGRMGVDVILDVGCTSNNTTFKNLNLSGEITSGNQILVYDCSIGNLDNFRGIMNNVTFAQGSEITLDTWANIIQGTAGGEPTNEVEISIGTAMLNVSHWTGNLKLKGKTGTDRTVINCDSGNIIIDSTCIAGKIQLLGTGFLEADNSGPGCDVDIEGFISNETITDAVWDETLTGVTHNIPTSSGRRLRELGTVVSASVDDPAATLDSFITTLTETRDDFYNDQLIRFTSGNLEGYVRPILSYNGTTKTLVVAESMIEAPDNGSDFDLIPTHVHPIEQIASATWEEVATDHENDLTMGDRIRRILFGSR